MASYLYKGITEVIEAEGKHELVTGFNIGSTWEDYLAGMHILLDARHLAFIEENPTASHKEIIDLRMTPQPPPPTDEEVMESLIQHIDLMADNRINERFPLRDVVDKVIQALVKEDQDALAYLLSYNSETTAIRDETRSDADAVRQRYRNDDGTIVPDEGVVIDPIIRNG